MKALTILQPWASLIACGAKKFETRSWSTKYRGPIAIHVAQHKDTPRCAWQEPFKSELAKAGMFSEYPGGKIGFSLRYNGCVIAIAELVACVEMTNELIALVPEPEKSFGWYEPGRFMWMLENVKAIEPVPAKGKQGIWEWETPWVWNWEVPPCSE